MPQFYIDQVQKDLKKCQWSCDVHWD